MRTLTVLAFLSVVVLGSGLAQSQAAEIGLDLGMGIQLDRNHDVSFALPAPTSAGDPLTQVLRVGLPLSAYDQIEIAPGFTHSSSAMLTASSGFSLGLSFLRGRVAGGHPSPYLRVGGHWRTHSFNEPYSHSASQFGTSGGAGLKWQEGKVFGFRSEALVLRWFKGGFPEGWDLVLRAGISAFTE